MRKSASTIAVLAFVCGPAWAEVTRIGTEGAYPPYNFVNDSGEVDGFERELGDELCARAKLDCVWVLNDWDSIIPNLVSGNYDAIMAGMSITEERDKVIDFTLAYLPPEPSGYMALSGTELVMSTGVIAVQTGTVHADYEALSGRTVVEFATPDETVAAVRNGEVDAVLADKSYLQPIIDASDGALEFVYNEITLGRGVGMGFRESDVDLRFQFEDAIFEMQEDGSLNALIKKWFGEDATVWE